MIHLPVRPKPNRSRRTPHTQTFRQTPSTGTRIIEPVIGRYQGKPESDRYLSEAERVVIADGHRAGKSARAIAMELGRAVSTVARELTRNRASDGAYHPFTAHALMRTRRPRPKPRRLEMDAALRGRVQKHLDEHWSPEQIAHELATKHGSPIAVETIYQALYAPTRVIAPVPPQGRCAAW